MASLKWDQPGERFYEAGVDHGVLYPASEPGVPWNGLIGVTEKPSGASPSSIYADDIKYLTLISPEEFGASLQAYTFPNKFAECDGSVNLGQGMVISQQPRKPFGLSYRTKIGNDLNSDHGYKLHLVYGCLASPSEKAYTTVNNSPQALAFNWNLTTDPVQVPGHSPTSHLIIDSREANPMMMNAIEDMLYGTATTEPRLPLPSELMPLIEMEWSIFQVEDNGDGTFTVSGPDDMVRLYEETKFELNSPTVIIIDEDSYVVSTL
jgi:hypothetical protein